MDPTILDASEDISNFYFQRWVCSGKRCVPADKMLWQTDERQNDNDIHLNRINFRNIDSLPVNESIVLIACFCTVANAIDNYGEWFGLGLGLDTGIALRFKWGNACKKFQNFRIKHQHSSFYSVAHDTPAYQQWLLPQKMCIFRDDDMSTLDLWTAWNNKMSIPYALSRKRNAGDCFLTEGSFKKSPKFLVLPGNMVTDLTERGLMATKPMKPMSRLGLKAMREKANIIHKKNVHDFAVLTATDNLSMAAFTEPSPGATGNERLRSAKVAAVEELRREYPIQGKVTLGELTSSWDKSLNEAEVLNFLQNLGLAVDWGGDVVKHKRYKTLLDLDYLAFEMKELDKTVRDALTSTMGQSPEMIDALTSQATTLVTRFLPQIRADANRSASYRIGYQTPTKLRPTIGHFAHSDVFTYIAYSAEPLRVFFIDPPIALLVEALEVVGIKMLDHLSPDGTTTILLNTGKSKRLLQHATLRVGGGPWVYRICAMLIMAAQSDKPSKFRYIEETYNGKERSYGKASLTSGIDIRRLADGFMNPTVGINVYTEMLNFAAMDVFSGQMIIGVGVQSKYKDRDKNIEELFPIYTSPLIEKPHYYSNFAFGNLPWTLTGGTYNIKGDINNLRGDDILVGLLVRDQVYSSVMRWSLGEGCRDDKSTRMSNTLGVDYFINSLGLDNRVEGMDVNKLCDALKQYSVYFDANMEAFSKSAGTIRVERAYVFQIGAHCKHVKDNPARPYTFDLLHSAMKSAFTSTITGVQCIPMRIISSYILHTQKTMISLYRHALETLLFISAETSSNIYTTYDVVNVFAFIRHVGLGLRSFYSTQLTDNEMKALEVAISLQLNRGSFGVLLGIPDVIRTFLARKKCKIAEGPKAMLEGTRKDSFNSGIHIRLCRTGLQRKKTVFICNHTGCKFRCISAVGFFQGHIYPEKHNTDGEHKSVNLLSDSALYKSMSADIEAQCGDYDVLLDALHRVRNGESLCFQGNAGTGKSYAISILAQQVDLMYSKKEVAFVAPNGMSCFNLDYRAQTIHALLGYTSIHIDAIVSDAVATIMSVEGMYDKLKAIRVIFFDEVGAISSVYGLIMDAVFRLVHENSTSYMGGVQIIAAGQLLQLAGIIEKQHRPLVQEVGVDSMGMLQEFMHNTTPIHLEKIFRTVNVDFQRMQISARNGTIDGKELAALQTYGANVLHLRNVNYTANGYMEYLRDVGRVFYFWASILRELRSENHLLRSRCLPFIVCVKSITSKSSCSSMNFTEVKVTAEQEAKIRRAVSRDDELTFFSKRDFIIQSQAGNATNNPGDATLKHFEKFKKGVRVTIKEICTSSRQRIGWDQEGYRTVNGERDVENLFSELSVSGIHQIVISVQVKIRGKIQWIDQFMQPSVITSGSWRREQLALFPSSLLPAMQMQGMTLGKLIIEFEDFVKVHTWFASRDQDCIFDDDAEDQDVKGLFYMMLTRVTTPEDIFLCFDQVDVGSIQLVLEFMNNINAKKRLAEDDFCRRSQLRDTMSSLRFLSETAMNNEKARQYKYLTQHLGMNTRQYKSLLVKYTELLNDITQAKNYFGICSVFRDMRVVTKNIQATALLLTMETSPEIQEQISRLEKAFAFFIYQVRSGAESGPPMLLLQCLCRSFIDGTETDNYWEVCFVSLATGGNENNTLSFGKSPLDSPAQSEVQSPSVQTLESAALLERGLSGILNAASPSVKPPLHSAHVAQQRAVTTHKNKEGAHPSSQGIHQRSPVGAVSPHFRRPPGPAGTPQSMSSPGVTRNTNSSAQLLLWASPGEVPNTNRPAVSPLLQVQAVRTINSEAQYSEAQLAKCLQGTTITLKDCLNFIGRSGLTFNYLKSSLGQYLEKELKKVLVSKPTHCFCIPPLKIKVLRGYYVCSQSKCRASLNESNKFYPKCSNCLEKWLYYHLQGSPSHLNDLVMCVGHISKYNGCPNGKKS
jgi:hypothetical protein